MILSEILYLKIEGVFGFIVKNKSDCFLLNLWMCINFVRDYITSLTTNDNLLANYILHITDNQLLIMEPITSSIEYFVDICPNKMLKLWDWDAILEKSNTLPLSFLVKHKHRFKGNLWTRISSHPDLTIEFINKHYTRYHKTSFNWHIISRHPNITMEIIDANPDKPWDWQFGVSNNPNFSMEYVKKNKNKNRNWLKVSTLPEKDDNTSESHVARTDQHEEPTKHDKNEESESDDESDDSDDSDEADSKLYELGWQNLETVEEFLNSSDILELDAFERWNIWDIISSNPNIDVKFIKKHINKPWSWFKLAQNPKLFTMFEKIFERHVSGNKTICARLNMPLLTITREPEHQRIFEPGDDGYDSDESDDGIIYENDNTSDLTSRFIFCVSLNVTDIYHNTRCINGLINNPNITLEFIETYIQYFDEDDLRDLVHLDLDNLLV